MAGRRQERQHGLPHLQRVTVLERDVLVAGLGLGTDPQRHLERFGELDVARDEIRMRMRQPDARDPRLLLLGPLHISGNIAARIDHQALVAADQQIGKM